MYMQSTFKKNGKRWGKKFKDDRDWSKYNEDGDKGGVLS